MPENKPFLGEPFYQELLDLVGPEAAGKLIKQYWGHSVYFPRLGPGQLSELDAVDTTGKD